MLESSTHSLPAIMNSLVSTFHASLRPGQLLESLVNSIPGTYYFVKNQQGQFVGGTERFAQLISGEPLEGIIGKTDYDFVPTFLAQHFELGDQKVLTTGEPIYDQLELVPTAGGSLDWLSTTKVPLFGTNDEVVGLAGLTRLISDGEEVYAAHPEMRIIVNYLRDHYAEKVTMAEVAKLADISVSTQERRFKKLFGITPLMYLQKIRLNAACDLLRTSSQEIATIAVRTGFNDQSNMTRAFRTELKVTPLKYRKTYSA